MAFRFIAGFPQRYRAAGCDWMLDPELAGGGCTINLAIHFFDLCRMLFGPKVRVLGATMAKYRVEQANRAHHGNHIGQARQRRLSAVTFERDGALCAVEIGYLYPVPTSSFVSAGASNITGAKPGASDLSIARPLADRRHPNSCCEVIP